MSLRFIYGKSGTGKTTYCFNQIKELISNGVNPNDICVLYSVYAQSRGIEDAFLENNISYRIVGSFAFYQIKFCFFHH